VKKSRESLYSDLRGQLVTAIPLRWKNLHERPRRSARSALPNRLESLRKRSSAIS